MCLLEHWNFLLCCRLKTSLFQYILNSLRMDRIIESVVDELGSLNSIIKLSRGDCYESCSLFSYVMPSNILRYNQAYKFIGSRFKSNARILLRVCLSTESWCSSRIQVDCKTSKEQAKVFYWTITSLYTLKLLDQKAQSWRNGLYISYSNTY